MNIKYKLTVLILLFAIIGTVGCGKNEETQSNEDMFTTILKSAPFFEQENFPEWLLIKIKEIESWEKDKSILKVRIYQGEWKNRTIYFITNNLSSCYFCDVYYENGEQIRLDGNNSDDFCIKSKNWTLIYEYGNAIGF
jgi:hypothetical protein